LREKLEGHEFVDVNQVLQRAVTHENRSRENRLHNRFKEGNKDKDRTGVGAIDENDSSDEESEVCMVEWVDTSKDKPITCTFLRPGPCKKDEIKFTIDVTKCDKLFDVLLQNNVIKLKVGHVIPTAE
jgi:hypothetical protein